MHVLGYHRLSKYMYSTLYAGISSDRLMTDYFFFCKKNYDEIRKVTIFFISFLLVRRKEFESNFQRFQMKQD